MKRRFYPVALNVRDRPCLVIGDDDAARTKSERLKDAGARVSAVGPASFRIESLSDQFLVVLSHSVDDATAERVAKACRDKRFLLAALDRPALCDVIQLSLFDRGRLRIGISTEGASPGLARKIREGLERSLEKEPIEDFLEELAALRVRLEKESPDPSRRREALLSAIEGFEFRADVKFP